MSCNLINQNVQVEQIQVEQIQVEQIQDIEDIGKFTEINKLDNITIQFLIQLYKYIESNNIDINSSNLPKIFQKIRRLTKSYPNKTQLSNAYQHLVQLKQILPNDTIRKYIKAKEMRGLSGVIVISVITSPYPEYIENGKTKIQKFSCKHDCHYCPRELDNNGREVNARSYLSDEPTVARGLRHNYNAIAQYRDEHFNIKKMVIK